MADLLMEQAREINECLKAHLFQIMNTSGVDKTVDWKKILAYLTLLMEYECFVFAINKENLEIMHESFDQILKTMSDCKESLNEAFKSCSETQIKKLNIMFFKVPSNDYLEDNVESNSEKENETSFSLKLISKETLKNFGDILSSK